MKNHMIIGELLFFVIILLIRQDRGLFFLWTTSLTKELGQNENIL